MSKLKNILNFATVLGCFLATLLFLSVFIYFFCTNILSVLAVWFSGMACSILADMTSLNLEKLGYIEMKLGDYVLLSRYNKETDINERIVGEIIAINDENYSVRVGLIALKINKKTLVVTANDNKQYKFFGVVQGS